MIGEAGFDDQDSISFTSSRGRIPLLAINTRQPSYEFNSSIDLQNEEEHDEEVGAVSRLWRYCEASEGEVKLILPDAVRVPYYLPRPRGMNKSSISIEERYLRILEKSTANSIVGAVARPAQQLPKRTRYTLSPREQLVERRLMDKYRQDPELAKELLRKVQARGRGWHPPRPKKVEQQQKCEMVSMSPERHRRATERRSTLILEQLDKLKEKENKWNEMINRKAMGNQETYSIPVLRQMMWLTSVSTLVHLNKIYELVSEVREMKQKDTLRWTAALRIQHCYRRYCERCRGQRQVKARVQIAERIKKGVGGNRNVVTYQTRREACSIILYILRLTGKTWKSVLLSYVRRVRVIQRRVRRHFMDNSERVEIVSMLLDRLFPAFYANAQLVMTGKGEDLQNLLSGDANLLQDAMRPYRKFQVVHNLQSASVHTLLRSSTETLRATSRFFGPAARYNTIDVASIKRKIILNWVFRKRWQFVNQSATLKRGVVHARTFSPEEVRAFMDGTADPLREYLLQQTELEERLFQEYLQSKSRVNATDVIRRFTRDQVFLPLLSTMTSEDLVSLYIEIAVQCATVAKTPRNLKSNGMSTDAAALNKINAPSSNSRADVSSSHLPNKRRQSVSNRRGVAHNRSTFDKSLLVKKKDAHVPSDDDSDSDTIASSRSAQSAATSISHAMKSDGAKESGRDTQKSRPRKLSFRGDNPPNIIPNVRLPQQHYGSTQANRSQAEDSNTTRNTVLKPHPPNTSKPSRLAR